MIRIVKLSGKYYGKEIYDLIRSEREDIEEFLQEGNPVILCNALEDLDNLDIDAEQIVMVEDE